MQSQMQQVERRVKGYWFHDGIGEMIGGAVFLVIGLYFALTELLGASSPVGGMLQAGFIVILLGLIYAGRVVIRRLKERYVFPRTGYLEYRVDNTHIRRRRIGAALTAAVIAVAVMTLLPFAGPINWVAAITGFVAGAILILVQARNTGIQRFFYLGLASILLGSAGAISGWPDAYGLCFYYAAMGLCFVLSGAFVFNRFLRDNPAQVEGHDEK